MVMTNWKVTRIYGRGYWLVGYLVALQGWNGPEAGEEEAGVETSGQACKERKSSRAAR